MKGTEEGNGSLFMARTIEDPGSNSLGFFEMVSSANPARAVGVP